MTKLNHPPYLTMQWNDGEIINLDIYMWFVMNICRERFGEDFGIEHMKEVFKENLNKSRDELIEIGLKYCKENKNEQN